MNLIGHPNLPRARGEVIHSRLRQGEIAALALPTMNNFG
jgi:hypothetical protein